MKSRTGFENLKLAELRSAANAIYKTNFVDAPAQIVKQRVSRIARSYMTRAQDFVIDGMFRAIKETSDNISNVARLWYPPEHILPAVGEGRFNRANEAVLYTSNSPAGAVYEVRPQADEIVTLLKIEPRRRDTPLCCVPVGMQYSLDPSIRANQHMLLQLDLGFRAAMRACGMEEKYETVERCFAYIATLNFPTDRPHSGYVATNIISDGLRKFPGSEGLVFPGVAGGLEHVNFRINPDAADRLFVGVRALECRVLGLRKNPQSNGHFFAVRPLRITHQIENDGLIRWGPSLEHIDPKRLLARPDMEGFIDWEDFGYRK